MCGIGGGAKTSHSFPESCPVGRRHPRRTSISYIIVILYIVVSVVNVRIRERTYVLLTFYDRHPKNRVISCIPLHRTPRLVYYPSHGMDHKNNLISTPGRIRLVKCVLLAFVGGQFALKSIDPPLSFIYLFIYFIKRTLHYILTVVREFKKKKKPTFETYVRVVTRVLSHPSYYRILLLLWWFSKTFAGILSFFFFFNPDLRPNGTSSGIVIL